MPPPRIADHHLPSAIWSISLVFEARAVTVSSGGSISGIVAYLQQNKTKQTAQPANQNKHAYTANRSTATKKAHHDQSRSHCAHTHKMRLPAPRGTPVLSPRLGDGAAFFFPSFGSGAAEDSQRGVGRQRRPPAARDLICPQNISGGELLGHRRFVQALCGGTAGVAGGGHTMRVMPPDTPTADDTRD